MHDHPEVPQRTVRRVQFGAVDLTECVDRVQLVVERDGVPVVEFAGRTVDGELRAMLDIGSSS